MKKIQIHFTLIEIVLAIFVVSLLLVAAITSLASIQMTWGKVKTKSAQLKQFQLIDSVVDKAFRNAIPFTWHNSKTLKEKQVFQGNENSVSLAYLHRVTESLNGGIRFITLSLDDKQNLVATYRSTPILYWQENDNSCSVKKEVVAQNVNAISFLYADTENGELVWYTDWDEENNPHIPLAIQIHVLWNNGHKEVWLRRTAGNSLNETLGKRQ